MSLSPVVLFVYNRPWHTQATLEALQKNHLAEHSDLIIYSDAPKSESARENVQAVRDYIKTINGFKSVRIIERTENWGLAKSIISGVTEVVNEYGRIIVLEDDILTSPYFLQYMNEGLILFDEDDRVISIHGYVYPVKHLLPEAFFLPGADCWGWATWQRGWNLFETDGTLLLAQLRQRKLTKLFDYNGAYPYTKMLEHQINGKNDSWAIRWYASAFLANKLTLYPGRSLVHNIGNDNSGTHCSHTHIHDAHLSTTPINLTQLTVEASSTERLAFEIFLRHTRGTVFSFLKNKIKIIIERGMQV
jgi:hypothetical protein